MCGAAVQEGDGAISLTVEVMRIAAARARAFMVLLEFFPEDVDVGDVLGSGVDADDGLMVWGSGLWSGGLLGDCTNGDGGDGEKRRDK
jgi:hypothetical protein